MTTTKGVQKFVIGTRYRPNKLVRTDRNGYSGWNSNMRDALTSPYMECTFCEKNNTDETSWRAEFTYRKGSETKNTGNWHWDTRDFELYDIPAEPLIIPTDNLVMQYSNSYVTLETQPFGTSIALRYTPLTGDTANAPIITTIENNELLYLIDLFSYIDEHEGNEGGRKTRIMNKIHDNMRACERGYYYLQARSIQQMTRDCVTACELHKEKVASCEHRITTTDDGGVYLTTEVRTIPLTVAPWGVQQKERIDLGEYTIVLRTRIFPDCDVTQVKVTRLGTNQLPRGYISGYITTADGRTSETICYGNARTRAERMRHDNNHAELISMTLQLIDQPNEKSYGPYITWTAMYARIHGLSLCEMCNKLEDDCSCVYCKACDDNLMDCLNCKRCNDCCSCAQCSFCYHEKGEQPGILIRPYKKESTTSYSACVKHRDTLLTCILNAQQDENERVYMERIYNEIQKHQETSAGTPASPTGMDAYFAAMDALPIQKVK